MTGRVRTCRHCAGPILPTGGPVGREWMGADGGRCGALNDASGRPVLGVHEPRARRRGGTVPARCPVAGTRLVRGYA